MNQNSSQIISSTDVLSLLKGADKPLLIDVRTAQEYGMGHVPGAINISHVDIEAALPKLAAHKDKTLIVYCKSGLRTDYAIQVLQQAGFTQALHLEGDMDGWIASGRPVE